MSRSRAEPSRASRARAAVGSPPGQCRQSNYPSPSPLLGHSLPLTMPSRSLTVSFPLCLTLLLYPSVYPSLLRSPPPLSLSLVPAPRSLAYDTTRFSRDLLFLSHTFISPRLDFHSARATLLGRSELYPPKFPPSPRPIVHARLSVRTAFNLTCLGMLMILLDAIEVPILSHG